MDLFGSYPKQPQYADCIKCKQRFEIRNMEIVRSDMYSDYYRCFYCKRKDEF